MPRLKKILLWLSLAGLSVATLWGIHSARLLAQPIWSPIGLRRFLLFSCGYAVWSALIIWFARRWFVLLTSAAALAWTVLCVGVLPPVAVGLFLLSSLTVGRLIRKDANLFLSAVLGMCMFMGVIGLAIYFPVNYPAVYVALFAGPLAAHRVAYRIVKEFWNLLRPVQRDPVMVCATALLGFASLPQLAMSLDPETSFDALSMHLYIPWSVYFRHYWNFDFRHLSWALMPMGGDWCFTGVFMLGGESAAKLLNFATMVILSGMIYSTVRQWLSAGPALVVAALFASTPLVLLVSSSMFVENIQAAFLFGGLIAFWEYRKTGAGTWLYSAAALLGAAMATKLGSIAFAIPFALLAGGVELFRRKEATALRRWAAVGIFLVFALPPYVTAYLKSGNPVFPFFNQIFQSPAFDLRIAFVDGRWLYPMGPSMPFDVIFHTHRYLESYDGALGFQYFLLLPLCLLLLGRRWPSFGWAALGIGATFALLTFSAATYVRYLYAALPLASVLIGLILARIRSGGAGLYAAVTTACVICLMANVYFLPAASASHAGFFLNPFAPEEAHAVDQNVLAVRRLVEYLNAHHPNEPVAMFETSQEAGLRGDAYLDDWHHFDYSRRMHQAPSALGYLRVAQELGIRHFVAPLPADRSPESFPFIQSFLATYTEPEYSYGGYFVAKLKGGLAQPTDADVTASLPSPGPCAADSAHAIDDLDARIRYSKTWAHGIVYPAAFNSSVSYSEDAASDFRLSFSGTEVTWVYNQAPNRGQADVEIDGAPVGSVDLHSPAIRWQVPVTFRTSPGTHEFRVKVRGSKPEAPIESIVDVDCLVIH